MWACLVNSAGGAKSRRSLRADSIFCSVAMKTSPVRECGANYWSADGRPLLYGSARVAINHSVINVTRRKVGSETDFVIGPTCKVDHVSRSIAQATANWDHHGCRR